MRTMSTQLAAATWVPIHRPVYTLTKKKKYPNTAGRAVKGNTIKNAKLASQKIAWCCTRLGLIGILGMNLALKMQ